MSGINRHRESE